MRTKETSHVAIAAVIVVLALLLAKCTVEAGTEPMNVNTSNGHIKETSSGVGATPKPFDFSDVVVTGLAGVGSVTSITATSPIVVTPSPLVATGVISVTKGNLTDAGTDGITVTGGTSAVLGAGTSLAQHVADASHNGYLSSADWTAFSLGAAGGTVTSFSAGTLSPIFTTSVANATTTPALSFILTNAAAHSYLGNNTGSAGAPDYHVIAYSELSGTPAPITPAALTKADDTNVTLSLGGTPATALLQATSLTLGWTGTLAAGRGGTGVSSLGNLTKSDDTNVTLTLGGTPTGALITSASIAAGWTGTLSQARGGFGKSTASTTDGQIPIGKTSDGSWNVNTITQGTGITVTNGAGTITIAATGGAAPHAVTFVVDGSGAALSTGTKSYTKIPYGGTLTGWLLIGSPSGSVTVDIFRAADGAGLPVTSIIGGSGTKPALSSAVENSSTSFTSWTSTTLTAKDNMAISLSGISTTTYCALTLYYQ